MTGLLAVGGGLATLPFLAQMSARHPDWFTLSDLADMFAVSESTPGPIGVNMATFVGYRTGGFLGAATATLALVLPCFIITLIAGKMVEKWKQSKSLQNVFYGLRPAVAGLIAAAGWTVIYAAIFRSAPWPLSGLAGAVNLPALILFAAILTLAMLKPLKKIHPVAYILLAGIAGIALKL